MAWYDDNQYEEYEESQHRDSSYTNFSYEESYSSYEELVWADYARYDEE